MPDIKRFEPRTPGRVVDKLMPVSTFLRDTFFPAVETFTTKKIELTFMKGAQLVAPHAAPYVDGIVMDRQSHEVREYEAPTLAPMRPITPEMLETTLPGENTHTLRTPAERQQFYIDRDAREMSEAIDRAEEKMVASLLTTGQITVRGYYSNDFTKYKEELLDYGFTQKVTKAGAASWDQSTATIYDDIETGCDTIRDAGYDPEFVIMGRDAWANARNNDDFLKSLDTRRVDLGLVRPNVDGISSGEGLKYIGDLRGQGVEMWVYYGKYKDLESGLVVNFIPDDHVLIAPRNLGDIAYGAVTWLDAEMMAYVTTEGTRIPRVKINANADVMQSHIYSRPVPRPYDVDAWYVIDAINA